MDVEPNDTPLAEKSSTGGRYAWVWIVLLLGILMAGAYFRLIGINWDDNHHLHPDERFLTMVETSISPVKNLAEYFNTEISNLNPHNRGHSFYVYGTLPLFLVRYVAEWIQKTGYDQVFLVGRFLSAMADLLTVLMVYLIAVRLYRKPRLGLLAAAFAALSVLPIQLSHYFTVDTFTNFFVFLAFYFAIRVLTQPQAATGEGESAAPDSPGADPPQEELRRLTGSWKGVWPYLWFGVALGMALASKVSAAPLALLLPAGALIAYLRLPVEEQRRQWMLILRNLVLAAALSVLVFRIFQPYAFSGPGFFGLVPNERWVSNLSELSSQSNGDVDFPPALQWARRPVWFAWQNMVEWGLGLPLGLLAWAGFLWMAWRMFKGEWRQHVLLWGWTAVYFVWQSLNFSRSMRYQLPVYPTLAIIAAWAIFALAQRRDGPSQPARSGWLAREWRRVLAAVLGVSVLVATFAWAFAFTRIYSRPVTRVAASQWIYQNVPSALNLKIETDEGEFTQPLAYSYVTTIPSTQPLALAFKPQYSGQYEAVSFSHMLDVVYDPQVGTIDKTLTALISEDREGSRVVAEGRLIGEFNDTSDAQGAAYQLTLDRPVSLDQAQEYYLLLQVAEPGEELRIAGSLSLMARVGAEMRQQILPDSAEAIRQDTPFNKPFTPLRDGQLTQVTVPHIVDLEGHGQIETLRLQVTNLSKADAALGTAEIRSEFAATATDARGDAYTFVFDTPVPLKAQQAYTLQLELVDGPGALALYGIRQAKESSWDDALPLGLDNFDPFDYLSGLYRSEFNFEMYWDDNADKLERFVDTLDQVDYIFISSNRQWGTTVRVPERYPLTTVYYRNLLGCPDEDAITWCYSVAEPGMFSGELGFDLVQVFQSDPNLGSIRFNTQFAEEAFTVYDHPKVLIFKKQADYDPEKARAILGAVDLSQVVHLTPRQAQSYPGNLMLPTERLAAQRAGGTWADLFDIQAWYNRWPGLGAVLWYLVLTLLGWAMYPLLRLALGGLADRGYPFVRLVGMLLLAYFTWLAGSLGVPFSRLTISLVAVGLIAVNLVLAWKQRADLLEEWRQKKKYFLTVEALALLLFLFFLTVRLGNSDLWHPYKGGEKPMDFSYLNAVLKSTTFPPYDPWFAGGYINYYYFGFVLVGVVIKWLGIVPSIAYNLFLPTLFSLVGLGAFSIGWNLLSRRPGAVEDGEPPDAPPDRRPLYAGLASTVGLLVLGNLGTVRMIWQGLQRLAAVGRLEDAGFLQHWVWTLQGLARFITGTNLAYGSGDWYWIPSRAIPGEPITEFPFFTFLYADPHAHLYALPLTLLVLAWALSLLRGRWQWAGPQGKGAWLRFGLSFFLGALVIGGLWPTNSWDFPTYLGLGLLAVVYTAGRYASDKLGAFQLSPAASRLLQSVAAAALLVVAAKLLYYPFAYWFGQGYTEIQPWKGDHTPFWSYLTHWGLFLFVLISWLVWETRDWMAKTPVSALNRLRPYRGWIQAGVVLLLVLTLGGLLLGVHIAWLALPMAAWALVLMLRPGQPDAKRLVLLMTAVALALTLAVEVIVLKGDIGRMNTVFKFYFQAWTLFSLSAAAALMWLLPAVAKEWLPGWRSGWQVALGLLVGGAALFPLMAGLDKITDRMSAQAPHTLDGMQYMATSVYSQNGQEMDLHQDYEAIHWMQENVQGSPVIVEANTTEYYWGNRFTIYTGLPGVVGWSWHQRQQRAIVPSDWVTSRLDEVAQFYGTLDRQQAEDFLRKYDVHYIIVGQLEAIMYPGLGLEKFAEWDGSLWKEVYHQDDTTIYEVIR